MHRGLAVFLITTLTFVGALHYAPLWIFVVVVPVWALLFLRAEDQRIRGETIRRVRERVVAAGRDEDEGMA